MSKLHEGLRNGEPGTAKWIEQSGISNPNFCNEFWMLRQVYLALGELDGYQEVDSLDEELAAEQKSLEDLKSKLSPSVNEPDLSEAESYFQTGKENVTNRRGVVLTLTT